MNDDLLLELLNKPAWHADALCHEYAHIDFLADREPEITKARQVCALCLVAPDCLSYAIEHPEQLDGTWGGTTRAERTTMRRGAEAA